MLSDILSAEKYKKHYYKIQKIIDKSTFLYKIYYKIEKIIIKI